MLSTPIFFILLGFIQWTTVNCFLSVSYSTLRHYIRRTTLFDGHGIAQTYSWSEDGLELELRIAVPRSTRAKDILFEAKPRSVSLKLKGKKGEETILLAGNRTMRGIISLDGTFWNFEDSDKDKSSRNVVVTIEKRLRPPKDDFEVIDYDWGGVYPDDADEVLERTYLEPEELNIREYAASLGVDIDNINMSLVDKTMFTSGINLTQSTLEEMEKKGLAKEVTQQMDGSEFVVNEDGEAEPYLPYGPGISREEIEAASKPSKIPFIDTESPWDNKKPSTWNLQELLNDIPGPLDSDDMNVNNPYQNGKEIQDIEQENKEEKHVHQDDDENERIMKQDPIGSLTVNRLKQILREQGLKVSGNKAELQQRLRDHIQSQL
jgi:SAP domain/CS domain